MKPTRDSPFYNDIDAPMHQYDLPSRISCLNMLWTPPDKLEKLVRRTKSHRPPFCADIFDNDLDSTDLRDRCTHCVQCVDLLLAAARGLAQRMRISVH